MPVRVTRRDITSPQAALRQILTKQAVGDQNAAANDQAVQSFAAERGSDPVGIGVKQRAHDARVAATMLQQSQDENNPLAQAAHTTGPLPDPNWDAWFQSMQEGASGKPVSFKQGPSFGSVDPYEATPNGQYGDVTQTASSLDTPSNQLGTDAPGSYQDRYRQAVRGLHRAQQGSL